MLGAIIGDIVGSPYEGRRGPKEDFELWNTNSRFTDDTVLTVAIAHALLSDRPYGEKLRQWGRNYPHAGYGGNFRTWLTRDNPEPYGSYGNGSAMRVSPVGYAFADWASTLEQARLSAAVTHNHPEGEKGAQAVAAMIFWAREGRSRQEMQGLLQKHFGYDTDIPLDKVKAEGRFEISCQKTLPITLTVLLRSRSFEHALRQAVSLGGDSDTNACIVASMAEPFYGGVPAHLAQKAWDYLPQEMRSIVENFQERYGLIRG